MEGNLGAMRFLSFYIVSLFISVALFYLVVPLDVIGLNGYFLVYPANGETEASKNFTRIFFIILPILVIIGALASRLIQHWLKQTHPKLRYTIPIFTLMALNVLLANWVLAQEKDAGGLLVVASIACFYYLIVLTILTWLIKLVIRLARVK